MVEEEKRLRIDNDPIGKAIEKFRALAYVKHPYNWTPIGTIEDLEKVTPADCQRFYDTYYQPNNATLIVVGDVEETAVRQLIEQHFGSIPRGPAPPRAAVEEPPQTSTREETLRIEVQIPVVVGGYHIPRAADPDVPALEVLAAALSTGESSRLHQRLVRREHLAIAAGGVTEALRAAGPVHRLRRATCPTGTRPACRRCCPRRSRACATSRSAPTSSTRRRTSSPPRSCSGCRPSTASRRRWGGRNTSRATGSASSRAPPATWP